ncbi:transposase [Paenibacillus dendritiformis]|uniref:transposase n=1 Tax=Paenibacillus dendritiformis TaxID=130049 RepID=UPI001BCB4BD6
MPGIGDKLAASLLAENGDATPFSNAKELVAYAGLDPAVYASGKFVASADDSGRLGGLIVSTGTLPLVAVFGQGD